MRSLLFCQGEKNNGCAVIWIDKHITYALPQIICARSCIPKKRKHLWKKGRSCFAENSLVEISCSSKKLSKALPGLPAAKSGAARTSCSEASVCSGSSES